MGCVDSHAMRDIAQSLYPVLLAGVDLAGGSLLYQYVSAVVGFPMIAIGILVVCSIAYHILSGSRKFPQQGVQDAVS
jgi:hypothetical protein